MRIRFQANREKPHAVSVCRDLAARARTLGLEVAFEGDADIVIALGGDGTILHAVHAEPNIPVLGFNLGGLGYLSSVGESDFNRALEMLAAGEYVLSERKLLAVANLGLSLNDVVVSHDQGGRAIRLDLAADGKTVAEYMADGLIIATPTGSTAYSLAAGGPILMPDSKSIVVTPLNPHALGVRPLVMPDNVKLSVTVRPRTRGNPMTASVYADGEKVRTLSENEGVSVATATHTAKLVELVGYDPYDVLARKLGWCGTLRKN